MRERKHSRRSFLELLATVPLILTLPSGLAFGARLRVQALRHWPEPEKTRLVFDLDGEARFLTRIEKNPDRILLVVSGAELGQPLSQTFAQDPLVQRVRTRETDEGVEILVELTRACELNAFPLQPNNAGKGHRIVLDVAPRLSSEEMRAEAARKEARINEVLKSGDRVIAIDAGHGGEDPGTVWGRSLREKEVVLEVAKRLEKKLLGMSGLRPIMTRKADYFVPLRKRQSLAKQYGADVFVSIHINAARSQQARGAEVFFLSLKGAESEAARELVNRENAADLVGGVPQEQINEPLVDILMAMRSNKTMQESERLADLLLRRLGVVQGAEVRGVKQGPLTVLKSINKPSVLVELGFFTNSSDRKLLADSRTHALYAEQLARGIADFLA